VLSLWKLLVLVAGYGASEAVFGPAYGAIVPELVDREVLTQANSLNQLNRPLALRLAGPALGGALVAGLGAGAALAVDAGTFFVSAAILSRMAVPRAALGAMETSVRAVLREVREGLDAVRRVPWLWAGMGADAIGTLATWGCVQALVPVLVRDDLGGSAGRSGRSTPRAASVRWSPRSRPGRVAARVGRWSCSSSSSRGRSRRSACSASPRARPPRWSPAS
jgi:DHA3 family tetracycline resistance protein-like MFS transporter